jgi:dGTPase
LQDLERKGRGWNLTLQVLDGIFCHDGEVHSQALEPQTDRRFESLDKAMVLKQKAPTTDIWPMTMEGCVVRMADTVSYIGRDIEDAIRLGLIDRGDLPGECKRTLGETNGTIVYRLVEDLVGTSMDKPEVGFSSEVGDALRELKAFNQEHIYRARKVKEQTPKIQLMFELVFKKYMQDLEKGNEDSDIFVEFLDGMSSEYSEKTPMACIVRDFIAGMTDDYFLNQCRKNLIPQIKTTRF